MKRKGCPEVGGTTEAAKKYPPRGNRFVDRVMVITGASGNFGSVCARMAAAEGARVAMVDMVGERLKALAQDVRETYGVEAKAYVVDVTKEAEVETMVKQISDDFGRIDCLFNNAGIQGNFAPVDAYSFEDFERVLKVNVAGAFAVLKHVSKVMVKQRAGSIVNTASCAGLGTPACMPAYGSSKVELQSKCGPTNAPEFYSSSDPEVVAKQMLDSVPLRRLGTPEEVVQTVLFLLSDESSYITGTDINVSGGNVLGGSRG
mmetsp:Transcript_6981/g.21177  ORF Transcript_6981/g.21177 Transcript_6981/m.21177 type:complete len:260 (+) Transcript_6981:47-826(+)